MHKRLKSTIHFIVSRQLLLGQSQGYCTDQMFRVERSEKISAGLPQRATHPFSMTNTRASTIREKSRSCDTITIV